MFFHLSCARAVNDAFALIDLFGPDASGKAAARAREARDIGNHVRFCHWRQIGRLIELLDRAEAIGTIH
jgi:hypothetical protein